MSILAWMLIRWTPGTRATAPPVSSALRASRAQNQKKRKRRSANEEVLLLTKMDLGEFRFQTLRGVGLGGLAASDGVGWVILLDGLRTVRP